MAGKTTSLKVLIEGDGSDAAAEFDKVGAAATDMGGKLDSASKMADDASHRLGNAADATDNLASKSSQATGGLGALASGFELVGLGPYAAGLQSAAMATDFFSGVGDIANLVLESQAVQTAKNTVLKAKDIVVTTAQSVATKASAAAQWALNAAMSANPIGLVIAAIVALVAIFVVAYKKSETFRKIVNGSLGAVKTVAGNVVGWFKEHWPLLLAIITGPFGLAVLAIAKNWDKITGGIKTALSTIKGIVTGGVADVVDAIRGIPGQLLDLGDRFLNAGETLLGKVFTGLGRIGGKAMEIGNAIINGIIDAINAGIDFINNALPDKVDLPGPFDIDLPDNPLGHLGHIGSGGSSSKSSALAESLLTGSLPTSDQQPTTQVTVNVYGAVDAYSTARQIDELLTRRAGWRGRLNVVGTPA